MTFPEMKTLDHLKKFVTKLRRGILRKQRCDERYSTARGLERQWKMLTWKKLDQGPVFFLYPYNESVPGELVLQSVWVETATRKLAWRKPAAGTSAREKFPGVL